MKAMILAAGRGQRLMPLTAHTPKPLVPFAGRPMIEWHLEKLARAGFTEVVINLSWLGEQIRQHLGDGARFGLRLHYSEEAQALETAGGIRHALPLLGSHFAVINADIWTDFDYARLRRPVAQPHLVLVNNPPDHAGDFALSGNRPRTDGQPRYTFSGLALYPARFFQNLPDGRPQPLAPMLRDAMANGDITAERYTGPWFDLGTAERIARAETCLRQQQESRHD